MVVSGTVAARRWAKVQGGPVESWAAVLYGDPCRECGFDWSVSPEAAMGVVADVPARYARLLGHLDGP